ncbi:MAG: T9SS type A sorting domain-containing protein [Aureispira sp.]|nr:T9SS type A sorting domain-containing protein [Aureispira sp.]
MKIKFIYVLLLSAFSLIVLQSRSGGAAANGLGDRTNSPLGVGSTCSACHSGGSFNPTFSINVKDANQNTVTSYTPGQSYTIEFNVTAGLGSPSGYGMQAVALSGGSGNPQAGTMGAVISSNTQITTQNSRSYVEHSGINASGTFLVNWTAPASGFGTVNLHGVGLAINSNSSTSGDETTSSTILSLTEFAPTTISYSQSNYCVDAIDPSPSITGTTGGTFTAMPAGLVINSTSGEVDLSASSVQTYTVSYADGTGVTSTATLTINGLDNALFTYPSSTACESALLTTSPTPAIAGGTWSSTSGLSINASTGTITPNTSTVGNYTITHTTNGACPNSETLSFAIIAQDVASFPFTDTTFCQGMGPNLNVAVTGTTSGFYFASPSGISFVSSSTGEININTSSVGSYVLSYISNGACPTSANANLTLALCSGVETLIEENNYELFPNPNNGIFSIKSNSQAGIVNINILDVLGKVVYTERSFLEQNSTKVLALEALAAGTYFVQVQQENKQQTFKVIIE